MNGHKIVKTIPADLALVLVSVEVLAGASNNYRIWQKKEGNGNGKGGSLPIRLQFSVKSSFSVQFFPAGAGTRLMTKQLSAKYKQSGRNRENSRAARRDMGHRREALGDSALCGHD